jgi:TPR repeat protein
MNLHRALEVTRLERDGDAAAADRMLRDLASDGDAMALIELGARHFAAVNRWPSAQNVEPNPELGAQLITRGRTALEALASSGDAEAMRMLGYVYLGKLAPHPQDEVKAEQYLLNAFAAGCHFAANDLHMFYVDRDEAKARYYYEEASRLGCKAVYFAPFEP